MKTSRLVLASIAVLLPVTVACSSSKNIAETPTTTSKTTTPTASGATTPTSRTPASPTTSAPSTPSVSITSPAPGAGSRLGGSGYSVVIPQGWEDITASLRATNPLLDIAIGEKGATGFRTNFNVVRSSSHPGSIAANGPAIRKEAASELKSITKRAVLRLADRTIDGEPAVGQTSTFVTSGISVTFVQYFVVHDGNAFPITMTFATGNKASALSTFAHILSTWQWDR